MVVVQQPDVEGGFAKHSTGKRLGGARSKGGNQETEMDPLVVVLMIVVGAGYLGGAGGMAMAKRAPPAAQHKGPTTLMVCCWQSSRSEFAVSSRSALGRRWR